MAVRPHYYVRLESWMTCDSMQKIVLHWDEEEYIMLDVVDSMQGEVVY